MSFSSALSTPSDHIPNEFRNHRSLKAQKNHEPPSYRQTIRLAQPTKGCGGQQSVGLHPQAVPDGERRAGRHRVGEFFFPFFFFCSFRNGHLLIPSERIVVHGSGADNDTPQPKPSLVIHQWQMAKNRTKIRYQHISCYPSAAASFLRLCGHFFVPKIYALCFVSPSCSRTLGRVDRHNAGDARIPSFEVSLVNGMLMFFSRQCCHPRNKIFWHFFFGTMMCTTFHRNAYFQYQRPVQSSRHHMLMRFTT